jgi:acetyl-CoA carboxylase biotin carboxyl carrier protein
MMDLDFLRSLIDIVENSDLDTVELEHDGTRIKLAKASSLEPRWVVDSSPPSLEGPVDELAPSNPKVETQLDPSLVEVKSPMVGTLYSSPSPDTETYVKIGSSVNQGDTLCILEAMKLMNELESEVSGVIEEICVQDGEPVQYGQVLFLIRSK